MLYMCTYTCGIWEVITWIRVPQHFCKTGNHFHLQVGPKADCLAPPYGLGEVFLKLESHLHFLSTPLKSHFSISHFVSCEGHRVFAWETSILGSRAQRSSTFLEPIPPLQSPPYGTLVTSVLLLSSSLPSITSSSLRTCFLLSLLNASLREMDEGENILQRWKFLRSYGYDLVGRSGLIFFFFFSGRLTVPLRWPCWASSTSKGPGVLNQGASALFSHTHLCLCSSVPLFTLVFISITSKEAADKRMWFQISGWARERERSTTRQKLKSALK